jgi:CBS domain-containing protein
MSPRAAWRLESIGFRRVYDYVAGKADWAAAGLPLEGRAGPRVGDHARRDVPTCGLEERLSAVRARIARSGWEICVVVNEHGIVLGRLGRRALRSTVDQRVEEAMTPGPSTIRPHVRLEAILGRMRDRNLTSLIVTRSDGTLVGVLRREEAEAVLTAGARSARGSG